MPSLFAELETIVSDTVDSVMGERTRIEPQGKGDVFSGSADDTRPPFEVIGVVDFSPTTVTVGDESSYDGFQPSLAGDRIHVSYALSSFQNASSYPRQNDVIAAIERSGTPKFRIMKAPEHDGIGRMICVCVPA
jgi:hypothetical protein